MPSVLFVVTAAEEWTLADGTKRPTGYWAEELIARTASSRAQAGISTSPPPEQRLLW